MTIDQTLTTDPSTWRSYSIVTNLVMINEHSIVIKSQEYQRPWMLYLGIGVIVLIVGIGIYVLKPKIGER